MRKCKYCGSTRHAEKEHVQAKSKGGRKTVKACRRCNRSKSNKGLMEWFRWLKKNDLYRWRRIKNYNYRKKNAIAEKIQKIRDEG